MRLLRILSLLCLIAYPLHGQEAPAGLPRVTKSECPIYPRKAEAERLQGNVIVQVTTNGHAVSDVKLISGPLVNPCRD